MSRTYSTVKKLVYYLLVITVFYGVFEIISFFSIWILDGVKFSFQNVRKEQSLLAKGVFSPTDPRDISQSDVVIHPYLGFVYQPQKDALPHIQNEHHFINEYGLLGKNQPIQKRSSNKVIIGITGGSVAYWFSDMGAEVLKRELIKSSYFKKKEIIIVAMALGGYKQPQALMAINYFLALGGEFDILLNIDGYNEVALSILENAPYGVNPTFPRGWNLLVQGLPDIEKQRLMGEVSYLKNSRKQWAESFLNMPFPYSISLQIIWKLRDLQIQKSLVLAYLHLRENNNSKSQFSVTGPKKFYQNNQELLQDIVSLWKRSSLLLDNLCQLNGVKYFHFLQPNQYVPGSKPMSLEEKRIAFLESSDLKTAMETGYPLLILEGKNLTKAGVKFHDLTSVFSNFHEPLYIDNCCHLNKKGNEILGRIIAAKILDGFENEKLASGEKI